MQKSLTHFCPKKDIESKIKKMVGGVIGIYIRLDNRKPVQQKRQRVSRITCLHNEHQSLVKGHTSQV